MIKKCIKAILTKMATLKRKPIMHGYRTSHGVDLNENGNFKEWKPIIHGYKHLDGGDLNEHENYKRDKQRYYLVDLLGWKH